MWKFAKQVLACLATVSAAETPGLGGSLTQKGLKDAKNIVAPFIFQYLHDLKLPDISSGPVKFTNAEVTATPPASYSAIQVAFVNGVNGVEFTDTEGAIIINADFTFHELFTVKGHANITITKAKLDLEVDVSQQPGTPADEMAPKLDLSKTGIDVNPNHVDIKLTGGAVSKIAGILIPLIKSTIIPEVIKQIQTQAV